LTHERIKTAANKVLPKAGLNGFDWTFVQGSTFILRLNFCAKIPAFGNTLSVMCKPMTKNYVLSSFGESLLLLQNEN
jgi:hypothetical protein